MWLALMIAMLFLAAYLAALSGQYPRTTLVLTLLFGAALFVIVVTS